jgi:16S rRNA (adenine1518-N6/adenine1519-N6)-dimethyltransferase
VADPRGPHRPRKRFGQHFLAPAWASKLVGAIAPRESDTFLEIGPGRGAITRLLAARAARVVAVEVDRDLAAGLRAASIERLEVVEADILSLDLAALDLPPATRIAGNLPYNISSPILFQILEAARRTSRFADATLMLQKEVADRLTAATGTKDYGLLTIFTALEATVTRQLTLPPGAFHPPPQVTSAVVRLTFLSPESRPDVPPAFAPMVRALFATRRKTILNGLKNPAAAAGRSPRDVIAQCGLDPRLRPEQLTVEQLLGLAQALQASNPRTY